MPIINNDHALAVIKSVTGTDSTAIARDIVLVLTEAIDFLEGKE